MPTLDWLNRAHAFTTAAQVPYRLLEPVSTHGDAASAARNLLIQGDNLQALKALLPFHRGQVKCIFIDPPYNTKSAFEHYDDNLEHSQWLSMMLPRLQLLRELLSDDGSIWVTIDDNEGHYLKVLMDEVFGRRNFVASFQWQKTLTRRNDAKVVSEAHDHVLLYGRDARQVRLNRLESDERQRATYTNRDKDPRGDWLAVPFHAPNLRPNLTYPITTPGGKVLMPPPGRCWSTTQEKFKELREDGRIYFGRDGNGMAQRKKFWSESAQTVVPWTWWPYQEVGENREATRETKEIFGGDIAFSTPKPERLIQRILALATAESDLVLDSFLGSGTTAAVAHKMGRRWIGIEMGEHAATHCLPRLQKVIAGEQGGISAAVGWQGGGGFAFAKLGAPIFDASGCIHPEVRFATLAAFIWQQETGTAFDAARGMAGTPYLGTHSVFDSCLRTVDGRERPISLEVSAPLFELDGGSSGADARAKPSPAGEAATAAAISEVGEPVLQSRTAYYLLFNGILGDKRPASGNVLTTAVLEALLALHASTPHPEAPLVVYGEACRLGEARLALARVVFKHIPYDVRAR